MTKTLLVLTNANYTIDDATAERIEVALNAGERTVTLDLDLFGEDHTSATTLAVSHVVAIARYDAGDTSINGALAKSDKVRPIR